MKCILTLLALTFTTLSLSQSSESDNVKATIERFFEGFHKQDSTIILETVIEAIQMQSIGKDKSGNSVLNTSDFKTFLNSIIAIPKDKSFKEELLDYKIQVDGNMAHAWTPYNFWYDKKLSHCGVNSFQLYKDNGQWKIIYLVDTRRQDCRQE